MLSDFYRPGVTLDFPKGGTQAIVEALVRGVTKHEGSHVRLNTHVAQLLIDEEGGRCVGVATADGGRVMARKAVISNADLWSTRRLVTAATGGDAGGSVRAGLAAELQARRPVHVHVHVHAHVRVQCACACACAMCNVHVHVHVHVHAHVRAAAPGRWGTKAVRD